MKKQIICSKLCEDKLKSRQSTRISIFQFIWDLIFQHEAGMLLWMVSKTKFRLEIRRSKFNLFNPVFWGELRTSNGSTQITGEFKLYLGVRIFLMIYSAIGSIGGLASLVCLFFLRKEIPLYSYLVIVILFFVCSFLLYLFYRVGLNYFNKGKLEILNFMQNDNPM